MTKGIMQNFDWGMIGSRNLSIFFSLWCYGQADHLSEGKLVITDTWVQGRLLNTKHNETVSSEVRLRWKRRFPRSACFI